jgi:hypothetical protein
VIRFTAGHFITFMKCTPKKSIFNGCQKCRRYIKYIFVNFFMEN